MSIKASGAHKGKAVSHFLCIIKCLGHSSNVEP